MATDNFEDDFAVRMGLLPPQELPVSSTPGALSWRPEHQSYGAGGRTSTQLPVIRGGAAPTAAEAPAQIAVGIVAGLKRRHHGTTDQACIEWPVHRLQMKFRQHCRSTIR